MLKVGGWKLEVEASLRLISLNNLQPPTSNFQLLTFNFYSGNYFFNKKSPDIAARTAPVLKCVLLTTHNVCSVLPARNFEL